MKNMKKIIALIAASALVAAGSLFAADVAQTNDTKNVVLIYTQEAMSEFGFSKTEVTAESHDFLADDPQGANPLSWDLGSNALYAGYYTNVGETVSLKLKATKFHNDNGGDDIGFTLESGANNATVEAGGAEAVILTDGTDPKALRANSTRLTYFEDSDFSKAVSGDYKSTLTLTYIAN